ncbi:hypothetical protein [Corynebacterium pilosum]|uniref:Hypothetical membrane protein n=1 Tax=Corynebacterium pilosum TaxID=35756 RepID=A0A376CJZ7_9CORY|nr:hypothetical protein [Corynebacterium pilosum]STC68635.1 hypothetical membrane protein [Corynebacterium pilosum]
MRVLYFILATLFTLIALGANWFGGPGWMLWVSLILAAIFLILGFMKMAEEKPPREFVLSDEQKETLRGLKAEGNESGAIRQLMLWDRYASNEDAQRIVRELD